MPLKVLYVLHTASLGGSGTSLRLLLRHLPPGTVEPTVLCPPGPAADLLRSDGWRVRAIPGISLLHSIAGIPLRGVRLLELGRTVWHMRYGRVLRRVIEEVRPDVVHLNERGMIHAAVIARRASVPVVLHARSVADRETAWIHWLSTALVRRYANRVLAIDESVRHSLREVPQVEVVYNPLPDPDPPLPAARTGRVRPSPVVTVTYLTGLLGFKGIWDLLEAARLLQRRTDLRFLIAGTNSRPARFHRSLKGRVAHLFGFAPDVEAGVRQWLARERLEGKVTLLGHVDRTDVLFAQTDILAFPGHLNAPGRSVFEAGAHEVPAIVAMRDRIQDIVVDGETGLIVPERDPTRLAAAIERLADDRELRRRLGAAARERYRAQFDPEPIARRVVEVYREVIGAVSAEAPAGCGGSLG